MTSLRKTNFHKGIMAGATGLEPATFGVTGRAFIQQIQRLFRLFQVLNGPEIHS
jgi:hypothetical protein